MLLFTFLADISFQSITVIESEKLRVLLKDSKAATNWALIGCLSWAIRWPRLRVGFDFVIPNKGNYEFLTRMMIDVSMIQWWQTHAEQHISGSHFHPGGIMLGENRRFLDGNSESIHCLHATSLIIIEQLKHYEKLIVTSFDTVLKPAMETTPHRHPVPDWPMRIGQSTSRRCADKVSNEPLQSHGFSDFLLKQPQVYFGSRRLPWLHEQRPRRAK